MAYVSRRGLGFVMATAAVASAGAQAYGASQAGSGGASTSDLVKLAAQKNKHERILARKQAKAAAKIETSRARTSRRNTPMIAVAAMVGVVAIGIGIAARSK